MNGTSAFLKKVISLLVFWHHLASGVGYCTLSVPEEFPLGVGDEIVFIHFAQLVGAVGNDSIMDN